MFAFCFKLQSGWGKSSVSLKNYSHRPALTINWVSTFMLLPLLWKPQDNKNGISDSSFPMLERLEGTR